MDQLKDFLGVLGTIVSSVQFIPQVYKTYKDKSSQGIAVGTYGLCVLSCVIWGIYGFLIKSFYMVVTNSFVALLAILMLIAKKIF